MPTDNRTTGIGLAEPPEGALVGENVPRENDRDETREAEIKRVQRTLGIHFDNLDDATLREKAESIVERTE